MREKYNSYWDAINIFDLNPYPKHQVPQISKTDSKKPFLEEDIWDKIYKVYLGLAILYYLADCLIKFYEMTFPEDYLDVCKDGFALHHIMTLFSFKSIFLVEH